MKKILLLCGLLIGFLVFFQEEAPASPKNSPSQALTPYLKLNTDMHTATIRRISRDREGRYLLTASDDKSAKLWEASTGKLIRTFRPPIGEGNEGMLYAGALSPDGKFAAVGGWTGYAWDKKISIYVFDTSSGQLLHRITGMDNVIQDLAFSPNGSFLAAGLGGSNGVRIFSVQKNFSLHSTHREYGDRTPKLAFDSRGRLATVSYDGHVRLYDADFKEILKRKTEGGERPRHLAFSPDATRLAVGYQDSPDLEVLDAHTLTLLYRPDITGADSRNERLNKVAFSSDGAFLFAGGGYAVSHEGRWQCVLRRWEQAGRGTYRDFPLAAQTIMDILPMGEGGIAFAGAYPDMGRIQKEGEILFYKRAETFDYAARDKSHLKISADGSRITVKPQYEQPFSFLLPDRSLQEGGFEGRQRHFTDKNKSLEVKDWYLSYAPLLNGKTLDFLQTHERSHSMDIRPDGTGLVFGASWTLYGLNAEGHTLWKTPTQEHVFSLAIAEKSQTLIAAMGDGSLRWYDTKEGTLLMSLFVHPDRKRWILWTPDGYFDSSGPDAESLVGWHLNQGLDKEALFYPLSRFYDRFYQPGLGMKVLSGENFREEQDKKLMANLQPTPLVRILSPKDRAPMAKAEVTLNIEVQDQGGGIDEIRLYHNDKLVEGTGRGFKRLAAAKGKETRSFTLSLLDGENRFRATAYNTQRTESQPHEILLHYQAPKTVKPRMYLLSVGIDAYKNPRYNLGYAAKDAETFAEVLRKSAGPIFERVEVLSLKNSDATREGLLKAIESIRKKARPEDVFVFYYAGHGVMSEGMGGQRPDYYMVLHDVTRMYHADDMLKEKGISAFEMVELLKNIDSRKQLMLLDSCNSGGAVDTFLAMRGAAEEKAIAQLARSTGTYVIAASNPEQDATEVSALGHGIFTYSMLQTIRGACKPMDKTVTVNHMKSCVENLVPELTREHRGSPQYPMGFGYGQDFPLGVVQTR